jgi:formylglycine-generating enzyme required for sulfatase activity
MALSIPLPAQGTALPVTMAWSPVGNPGNTADPLTGYGAVAYNYGIGTYDVTNTQYVTFLDANDPTGADPLNLYNTGMSTAGLGGASYNPEAALGNKYSVIAGTGNQPVISISWYDAIRFANWMDNGQPIYNTEPTASNNATENGSYTLDGFESTPSNASNIIRNPGATIVLPSENEWYKAAYYNPAASSYYLFPTSSNTLPIGTSPTATPNSANYDFNGGEGRPTNVGALWLFN